jgi:8-oxo-dGTP diphosphatase
MPPSPRPLQPDGRVHGVAVAVRRDDGKWLMVRRSKTVRSPLKVCFPGGTIEAGESQEEAVVREMKEEVGLDVRPIKQVWKHEFADKPLTLWGWIAEVDDGTEILVNEDEIAQVIWMDAEAGSSHPDALPTNRHFLACLEARR